MKLQNLAANHHRQDVEWNITKDPDVHMGRWLTISIPPFPGRLQDDNSTAARYTLGRMSFNMFKPTKAICTINQIFNVIEQFDTDESNGTWEQSYNFEVLMDIAVPINEDGGETSSEIIQLPAKLVNYGSCKPAAPTRLAVKFTSGVLQPHFDMALKENELLTSTWRNVFDGAITKEVASQSLTEKLTTAASNVLMKLMMGLSPPVDCDDLTQTYNISRPIAGHLDILYMDDDIRISRGNRGTIVVVERVKE